MKYNPTIHHRRSIRLKGYDYSQAGLYFVTICTQNRQCLFGNIVGADLRVCPDELGEHDMLGEHAGSPLRVILNDAGKMIEKWCAELPNKFPDIVLDEFVIMPNHFHAIIINTGIGNAANVGADLRVCPDELGERNILGEHTGSPLRVCPDELGEHDMLGEHAGSPLHRVVQWFKTMTTNEYIRGVKTLNLQTFNKKMWQRNYWEHIIRNAQSHQHIKDYIINNPANWEKDEFYTK